MSQNFLELFKGFAEAEKAMQRVPELEAELSRTQGDRDLHLESYKSAQDAIAKAEAKIAELNNALQVAEKAASEATFREQEVGRKLQGIVSVLKDSVISTQLAIDEVEPPKQAEPVAAEVVTPDPFALQSGDSTDVATDTHDNIAVVKSYVESLKAVEVPTTTDGPFASSTDEQSPPADDTSQKSPNTTDSNTASIADTLAVLPPKPFEGKLYWHKSPTTSWREWVEGGGQRAPWLQNVDIYPELA